nr:hypothetical protein [Tanacetum cinerariifolium]GEX18507.1 hypothetical protein [Tanacetum cinerariifolium]
MKEYIRLEEEKHHRHGKAYNWETTTYGKIWNDEDVYDLRFIEIEFPTIVFNDTSTSKVALSYEPTVKMDDPNITMEEHIEKDRRCGKVYKWETVTYDKDDDDKIDINQSSGGNVINTDDGAYAQGSNKLLETSHDKSNKFFKAENIKELNVNIMTWNHLNKGMSFIFLIKNLYVPFGIPFDPKLFYKDGIKLGQV